MTSHPLTESNAIAGRRARSSVNPAAAWRRWRAAQRLRTYARQQARHDRRDRTDSYLDETHYGEAMASALAAARQR